MAKAKTSKRKDLQEDINCYCCVFLLLRYFCKSVVVQELDSDDTEWTVPPMPVSRPNPATSSSNDRPEQEGKADVEESLDNGTAEPSDLSDENERETFRPEFWDPIRATFAKKQRALARQQANQSH